MVVMVLTVSGTMAFVLATSSESNMLKFSQYNLKVQQSTLPAASLTATLQHHFFDGLLALCKSTVRTAHCTFASQVHTWDMCKRA